MAGDSGKSADKTKEGGIDHDSPYYLHPSDYPRQMHVNDVLNDGNYADWSQEMLNFLFAKNKAGFINGSIKKPEEKSSEFMPWMRCDAMIKGWLHTAMEKEIRSSVKYAMTAREIWVDLKERFGKVSAPRAYELKRSLTFTKQDGTSVSAYYTKLCGIWDEIQSTIRTQILAMDPIPSLGNAYHLVAEDEQQRTIAGTKRPSSDSVAFQAQVTAKRDQSRLKQKDVKQSSSKPVGNCTNCGKDGHNRDGCFELIEGANAEESGPKANLAGNIDKEGKWIFDSGTTEHITHNDSLLKNKRKRGYEQPVTIPNGEADLYSRTLIGEGDCEDGMYKMGMFENNRHAMMTTQSHRGRYKQRKVGVKSTTYTLTFLKIWQTGCRPSTFPMEQNLKLDKCDKAACVDGCPMTRRSRTGYLLLLGGAPVSWKTKKQSVVSKSSAEAEYRAMSNAVSEILWMRWLLGELDMAPVDQPHYLVTIKLPVT
ncbi:LTR copia-type gag-polypeptide [Tanacetum coccineum]